LPSDNEGMSNAVLEGMASGLVLLLTDVGGTKELLEVGSNGYLVERTVKDITKRLKKLIVSKQHLSKMGKISRKITKQFSWQKVSKDYKLIYNKCAG
jgi:glycosyltransferase involved in cell wall biosynthesis